MSSLVSSAIPATQHFLSKPFRRNKKRYELNPPDVVHNVIYLGNVLTVMAKGEDSVGKPLSVIWRTYNSKKARRDIAMKLTVTRQGLKATSKQGLTEYWAHRITYCVAPPEYPRIFCWVYKHEGKRMRPELRCHAVLCKKAEEPIEICTALTDSLHAALLEYRREKSAVERARKNSLCSGLGGVPPRRKLMLQTGSLNFRPPVCRSKSAPRLGCIDEEDEHNELVLVDEDDNEYDADGFSDIDSLSYRTTPMVNGCGSSECEGSSYGGNESSTDSASGSGGADYHPDDSSSIASCSNKSPSPPLTVGRLSYGSYAPSITRADVLATHSRSLDEAHSNSMGFVDGENCTAACSLPDRQSLPTENNSARSLYLKKRWHQQQTVGRQHASCIKLQGPYVEVAATVLEELTLDEGSGECNDNNNNCQTEYSGVEFVLSSSYCSASTSASSSFDDGVVLGGARNPQDVAPLRTHKPTDCDSITADALEQYILKASRNNRLKFCAQDSYGDSLSDESGYAEEINLKPTKEKLIEKPSDVGTDISMTRIVTARLVIMNPNKASDV